MTDILSLYDSITLGEMSGIRLMNRTDTKFVTTKQMLRKLLLLAKDDYCTQEIDGERIAPYYTVYFDTPDNAMYCRHEKDTPTGRNYASGRMPNRDRASSK